MGSRRIRHDWAAKHTTQCPATSFFMAFILKSMLSHMSIATIMFLSFLFVWNISWLVICVSLIVKWVSGKQHVVGCCFIIQSAIVSLLIRVLSPLIFKVIFHKYTFIAILNIFSGCFCISSFFLSFSASFLFCGLWFSFKLCFSPLLFGFSESVACILFVVTLIFNHVNPLLYLLSLNRESNKLKHIQKKKFYIFFLPSPTFYDFDVLFYIFIFIIWQFIVVIIAFTNLGFFLYFVYWLI